MSRIWVDYHPKYDKLLSEILLKQTLREKAVLREKAEKIKKEFCEK